MALDAGAALERFVLRPRRHEDYYHTLRSIASSAGIKRFRDGAKACCVPIVILLVIAALGPEKWAPRTHLGWQFDHFIGYFGITLFFCFAWPRPLVVGGAFMVVAALLEGLQAFTPDRHFYLPAVFYGAGGALAAAAIAEYAWRLSGCWKVVQFVTNCFSEAISFHFARTSTLAGETATAGETLDK